MMTYRVNEIYLSQQGEGKRAGTENVFIRLSGCNMRCDLKPGPKSPGGFQCDTEFVSGRNMSSVVIAELALHEAGTSCGWVILTGGEPALQADTELIDELHRFGFQIAVETNGSIELPEGIDWITVSPKVAEHCIRQRLANEVKYVRRYGQAIPKTVVSADHYLISPAFDGQQLEPRTLEWCKQLVEQNPPWELSMQMHKVWKIA